MKSLTSQSFSRSGVVLALVMALAATAAWARDGGGFHRGDHHEKHFERMAAELGLSDTQRAEVERIMSAGREQAQPYVEQLKATRKSMQPIIAAKTLDETAVRSIASQKSAATVELAVIRARGRHEIRALLTPEQQQQLDAMHDKRMARHHKAGREKRAE